MAYREYIGSRYVPIFGRKDEESIAWDNTKPYEPLTIVLDQGNSYTSRQYVPAGIDISNQDYWALTGNYNAQIEQYRAEVQTFDERITGNSDAIAAFNEELGTFEDEVRGENFVTTPQITDGAVTSAKIADKAVTPAKLNSQLNGMIRRGIILIGDSWGEGYTPDGNVTSWITYMTNYLQPKGYVIHSSYHGGSGFLYGVTFLQQLQELTATLSNEEKDNIGMIYFGGGWNDNQYTEYSEWTGALSNLNVYVNANYPNAHLIIDWFGNGDWVQGDTGTRNSINRIGQALKACSLACTEGNYARFVDSLHTLTKTNQFASDGYHPNEMGQRILTAHILNLFYGLPTRSEVEAGGITLQPQGHTTGTDDRPSLNLQIDKFIDSQCDYFGGYLSGKAIFSSSNNVQVKGSFLAFTMDANDAINALPNRDIDIPYVCSIQLANHNSTRVGQYFTINGFAHIFRDGSNITVGLYANQVIDSGGDYLSGQLKQIEFL